MPFSSSFSLMRSIKLTNVFGGVLSVPRTRLSYARTLFFCQAKFADSWVDGSLSSRMVPPTLFAAEKEEANAVLTLFLKKQGLSNAVAARIINKSDLFVEHLVSRLHSVHKSWTRAYNSRNVPVKGKPGAPVSSPHLTLDSKKLRAVSSALSRISATDPAGKLRPLILYLMDLGMDLELLKGITRRFPSFAYYSLEGKIKPVVEFLLDLGVPKSKLPTILSRRPELCGISLSENLIPTMTFLENLGVDKRKWAKVIFRHPGLLIYSRQKVETTVDFLYEMGLSAERIGQILTHFPNIASYSVEGKLRPTAEYFRSLGVDVAFLLHRCPQTFGLSIEANLKPVTEFFLGRGYSIEEIGTMISRFGYLYAFSLKANLIPKWEFFLTMDYSKEELVKCPRYFSYSLEKRIKPRFAIVKESGVKLLLNQMLSLSQDKFDEVLKKKKKKMLSYKALSDTDSSEDRQRDFDTC